MVAFHEIHQLAQSTLLQLQARPEFSDVLDSAESHYHGNYPYLHAVGVFLLSNDASQAAIRIGRERSLQPYVARTVLSDAIADGPDWLKQPDYLYERGLIRAGEKYQVVPDDLKKGSAFDTACRQLPPAVQPLMDKIIAAAFSHKKVRNDIMLGTTALQYAAAQLMEEGTEKKIRFDALALNRNSTSHKNYLMQSARTILYFAREEGLDLAQFNIVVTGGAPKNRGAEVREKSCLQPAHRLANGIEEPDAGESALVRSLKALLPGRKADSDKTGVSITR